jgi:hypothetical protein
MKISKCKHCGKEFDTTDRPSGWMANHSRWCDENPKRSIYKISSQKVVAAMNASRAETGITNQYTKAKVEGLPVPESTLKGKVGHWLGKTHSEKTKKLISEKARASTHRRLRKGMVEYNGVWMDSSWEVRLAQRLDSLGISWERPDPLPYTDIHGKKRNYFPDFYLPEYDVYLDPKNPAAYENQKEKIKVLLQQYKNIVILTTLASVDTYTPLDNDYMTC